MGDGSPTFQIAQMGGGSPLDPNIGVGTELDPGRGPLAQLLLRIMAGGMILVDIVKLTREIGVGIDGTVATPAALRSGIVHETSGTGETGMVVTETVTAAMTAEAVRPPDEEEEAAALTPDAAAADLPVAAPIALLDATGHHREQRG